MPDKAVRVLAAIAIATFVPSPVSTAAQEVPGRDTPTAGHLELEYLADVREHLDSLMTSWTDAWNVGDVRTLADSYAEDAILVAGGGAPIVGREAIVRSLGDASAKAGRITVGMSDIAASDNMAYEFGSYRFTHQAPDSRALSRFGHQVVVAQREGGHWRIRAQLLLPATTSERIRWFGEPAEAPPPERTQQILQLAQRCRAGLTKSGDCRGAFWLERIAAGVNAAHAAWRDAWQNHDAESAARVFVEAGLLMLPDGQMLIGRQPIGSHLEALFPDARALHSSILDLDEGGQMAYAYGRYYCESGLGDDALGHYLAVHEDGNGNWRFRALILWGDSES
ncbi:MAG: SgcJ/EcaC family oxidoreductase [Gemmatimonadota bacterium]|nr:MAG: SgcJ/EcaC family oxidoreductase [Gemmatimonadota bacterium]